MRSQPGLGVVLGARVLGEFGDDPDRYQTAKGRKAFAGTAPVTGPRGCAPWWWPGRRATSGWWMPVTCGRSRPLRPRRARGAAMTPTEPAAPPTIRRCGRLGNRLVGILHGCLARRVAYQEQVAWPAAEPAA